MDAKEIRLQYFDLGYDCIPLKPREKQPLARAWEKREPFRQWQNAPADANFGLRAGNGKAFIDCDTKKDPATTGNVIRWLDSLGIREYPIVTTPSGGAHIYLNFNYAAVPLLNSRKLISQMGAGEFRCGSGAYVAAPPSVLENGGTYTLTGGDLARLPSLDLRDIRALVRLDENEPASAPRKTPAMSSLAKALTMGQGVERYKSRSEAEAALMLSLLNSGFEYLDIRRIFDTMPCAGKYAELKMSKPKSAEAYFQRTYENALEQQARESSTRRKLREMQEVAEYISWSRVTDKLVYQAHLKIAQKAGRFEYAASSRNLALEAGLASNKTAANATRRLIARQLLKLKEPAEAIFANRYVLLGEQILEGQTHTLPKSAPLRKCVSLSTSEVAENGLILNLGRLETADAFRNGRGRLGRRAGQLYKLLFTESLTVPEIAKRTGASLKTVRRTLKKLTQVKDYKTGEILELVHCEAGRWHSVAVDLEILEEIYGTRGATEKQRIQYEKERRQHARDLERGSLTWTTKS